MDLLSKEHKSCLDDSCSKIMDAVYSVTQEFCIYQIEHPDENLAEVEKSVSQGVWRLLKAEEIISLATGDFQYELGEGDDDA